MALTARAQQYLQAMKRSGEWVTDKDLLLSYLAKQPLALSEPIINAQLNYGGYTLKIKDHNHDFELTLFLKKSIINNEPIETDLTAEGYLLEVGGHQTAQYRFYITEKGAVCTWDGRYEDEAPNIFCSSVEKLVEQYALTDELSKCYEEPYYYSIKNQALFSTHCSRLCAVIEECSDDYALWYKNDEVTVVSGTFFDSPFRYVHVYGKTEIAVQQFLAILKTKSII